MNDNDMIIQSVYFTQESNVDCTDLDPDSYVDAMYGSDEQWDAAVEQKKALLMGAFRFHKSHFLIQHEVLFYGKRK